MTTTMAEPEWDEETRLLALALDDYTANGECPVCHRPAHICQDESRQFDWTVGAPVRCHATTAVLERQKGVTEETNPQRDALFWPVSLRSHSLSQPLETGS